jgi:hypothetical protein
LVLKSISRRWRVCWTGVTPPYPITSLKSGCELET